MKRKKTCKGRQTTLVTSRCAQRNILIFFLPLSLTSYLPPPSSPPAPAKRLVVPHTTASLLHKRCEKRRSPYQSAFLATGQPLNTSKTCIALPPTTNPPPAYQFLPPPWFHPPDILDATVLTYLLPITQNRFQAPPFSFFPPGPLVRAT